MILQIREAPIQNFSIEPIIQVISVNADFSNDFKLIFLYFLNDINTYNDY